MKSGHRIGGTRYLSYENPAGNDPSQWQPSPQILIEIIRLDLGRKRTVWFPTLPIRKPTFRKQLTKLVRLSWLSPNVVEAITDGRAPASLTRK